MYEKQAFHDPERNMPKVVLKEGVDYTDHLDLHAHILNELKRLGAVPSEVLLCGFALSSDSAESGKIRTGTFAMTIEETEHAMEYGVETSPSPYVYAEDAFSTGDRAVVAAYRRSYFTETAPEHYVLQPGTTIEEAILMTVELTE